MTDQLLWCALAYANLGSSPIPITQLANVQSTGVANYGQVHLPTILTSKRYPQSGLPRRFWVWQKSLPKRTKKRNTKLLSMARGKTLYELEEELGKVKWDILQPQKLKEVEKNDFR